MDKSEEIGCNGKILIKKEPFSRARPHEVIIELRKSIKENRLFQRRSFIDEDLSSPLEEDNTQSLVELSMDEIVIAIHSENEEYQFLGMQQARKKISHKGAAPIDLMIGYGIVPISIRFLQNTKNTALQLEAAWLLTNIAAGSVEQTRYVIDQNAVPNLIALLPTESFEVAKQVVWALANIAANGNEERDIVIQHNVIDKILPLMGDDMPISFPRTIVWLISILCEDPLPPFEQVKRMLPVLSQLLIGEESKVQSKACWILANVVKSDNLIQAVLDTDAVPRLVYLLDTCSNSRVIVSALRCIGNIVSGTDRQTDAVIDCGVLPTLGKLLQHSHHIIVKEAAWILSNITCGTREQMSAVLDSGIFHQIRHVLDKGGANAQKEAAWAVTNATSSGTADQIVEMFREYKLMKPFLDLLAATDPNTIQVVLGGISNLFGVCLKLGGIENLCVMIDDLGGFEKLHALERHENEQVRNKTNAFMDKYF
ncbi:importin subunit alpha-like [Drosophila innubila]|uniref:importin subunit alpha-like n=1 Tax=Drosophila innubila TaxID=198719 RepID=UPI00148BBA17|nr:importin subunit alpha-like [Drosophila innubila]